MSTILSELPALAFEFGAFTLKFLLLFGGAQILLESLRYDQHMTIKAYVKLQQVMAMMLLGSFLLDTDWKTLINKKIIAFTVIKMVLLPIAVTLILKQFVSNVYLLAVCMAALATPSGNVIPLLAALYNKEGYPVSVQGVAVTTAAAVVTMPIAAMAVGL